MLVKNSLSKCLKHVSTEGALKCIEGIQMCFIVDIDLPHFKLTTVIINQHQKREQGIDF